MSIQIIGLEGLLDSLDSISEEKITAGLQKACALVEREAKQKISSTNGTGELRRSITSEVNGTEGKVFTPVEYAPYVEYGTGLFAEGGNGRKDVPWHYSDIHGVWHSTSGQHPQPFLRPALLENEEKIVEIVKEELLK